ncbi:MAG: metalloregulator ArsR/SmtB family transcription factor [Dehalococcoidales bacterium]|jgi:ArsR family transcriptional regulator|nr:metalloregulator ArsR/SmtB family transcription factor [Dehalococcoidales bacterium]
MNRIVKALKAISEETRIRIINILLERECCVCEVMQALEISQTRASRNLNILYDAGFLKLRKEGLWSIYSLDKEGMPPYLWKLVEAIGESLKDNKIAIQDRQRLEKASRTGVCSESPACDRESAKSTISKGIR